MLKQLKPISRVIQRSKTAFHLELRLMRNLEPPMLWYSFSYCMGITEELPTC